MILQCKDYREDKVVLPVLGEVKMNGIFGRWDVERQCFFTRSGKLIRGLSVLIKECQNYPSFDCELVIPGVDFFTANGMIRSYDETPTCIAYVFDLLLPRCTARTRYDEYHRITNKEKTPHVHPLKGHVLKTIEEIDAFYKRVLKAGHEGIVIKTLTKNYYNGKQYWVQKRVPWKTTECRIINVIEGKKSFAGMMGSFEVDFLVPGHTTKYVIVKVGMGPGIDHAYRRKVWANKEKYIGQMLKIKYKSVTPDGSMQSPKIEGIRWDI